MIKKKSMSKSQSKGSQLWEKAKSIIPGGNMLLSKRSEMFLPEYWPSYFKSSRGIEVVDLDDNRYLDCSLMGVGTNTLGYGCVEVDDAVVSCIRSGNMSTLNCPEEVSLAESLVQLHPWAHMVKLARTGGEANAISVRIARASSGRDKVAICGYHGWHDWYLSTNLQDSTNLSEHLLPGLEPNGVPTSLKNSVIPFSYNNISELRHIIRTNKLAAVKMEVERSIPPNPGFLQEVRALCTENNIVLIFDECTSGFRETSGGLHLKYDVCPDIAVFGKTLGNGYAITAVIGIESVMQAAQSTFMSSTFWSERIGPTAACKTLEVMARESSWVQISALGKYMKKGWLSTFESVGIDISISGLDALATYSINHPEHLLYKSYITQEMLKRGFLASNAFYASTMHSTEVIDSYLDNLMVPLKLISEYYSENKSIANLLEGPICHSGFKRLN